jgi:hypothetical protein
MRRRHPYRHGPWIYHMIRFDISQKIEIEKENNTESSH